MLLTRNLIIAVGFAVMLAQLISFLPAAQFDRDQRFAPVFQPTQRFELSENNLVDVLSLFQTRLAISRVQWENDNLFINYKVDKEKPIYVEEIYEDLFSSLKSTFLLTSNVKSLYVRVLYMDKGREEVLIALSSDRDKKLEEALEAEARDKREFLQTHTRLSYGAQWRENAS